MKKLSLRQQVTMGLSATSLLSLLAVGLPQTVQAEEVVSDEAIEVETSDTTEETIVNEESIETTDDAGEEAPVVEKEEEAQTPVGAMPKPLPGTGENEQPDESMSSDIAEVPTDDKEASTPEEAEKNIALEDDKVYMTEPKEMVEHVTVGDVDTDHLTWTLNGKPIEEINNYEMETGDFTGSPFLTVNTERRGNDLVVKVNTDLLFGEDLSLREPNNIRRTYRHYIGDYDLIGTNADKSLVLTKRLTIRPYANYHSYEELMTGIKKITEREHNNRYVATESYGKSAQGRPLLYSVVAKDKESIDRYLNEAMPIMMTRPEDIQKLLDNEKFDYKIPLLFHNTHADEQPGVDIVYGLFDAFANREVVTYQTTTADGKPKTVTLNIPELLDRFIFLFSFAENPDGVVDNTRVLANGLDPNRDTGYQTNPETQAVAGLINQWNPLTLIDFHGFVREFLIEPTTPPHDPNFEYDLTSEAMMAHAHEMGRAGIANSKYEGYIIPKIDYGSGWDDAFSGYTAVYGLYHGILGYTVEIPETNQDSYYAGFFAGLASIAFADNNRDDLLTNRLTFYRRGLNKIEDPKAEEELFAADGTIKGRPRKEGQNFFPDYYVIPMTPNGVSASDEAFSMIEYFKRNGVIVKELTQDYGEFKKGDLVIDMAQAKRGYANHVLYPGMNESDWDAMYAELVVNFPVMRGFKSIPVYTEDKWKDVLGDVTHKEAPRSTLEETPYHRFSNNSVAAIQAVNYAIKKGYDVYAYDDSFIVNTDVMAELLKEFPLYAKGLNQKPVGETIKGYKIYTPNNYVGWMGFETPSEANIVLKALGFEIVNTPEEADVIVLDNGRFDESLLGLKPTLIIGGEAADRLEALKALPGFDAEMLPDGWNNEGLMKAHINKDLPISSGYLPNDYFYSTSGTWIESTPENFTPVVSLMEKDYFISGWWPGFEKLAGKVMAIDGLFNGQPLFIYAGNPLNRQHPHAFYRWVTNAIFRGIPASLEAIVEPTEPIVNPDDKPQPLPGGEHVTGNEDVLTPSQVTHTDKLNDEYQTNQSTLETKEETMMKASELGFEMASQGLTADELKQAALPATGQEITFQSLFGLALLTVGGTLIFVRKRQVKSL